MAKVEDHLGKISTLIPISELSIQAQKEALAVMELLEFKKKKFIFKQGDRDHYSYYVLEGEIELLADNTVQNTIVGGAENAKYAMAQLQPRQFSARAKTVALILRMDKRTIERLMVHEGSKMEKDSSSGAIEVGGIEDEEASDWMTRMLQSELFALLPMANIQRLFAFLEPVEFEKGDTVIKQGDAGDTYFIIQDGRCAVMRAPKQGDKFVKLAELAPGDSFGEEALLGDTTRNATVKMLTDGTLMKLNKENFSELIKDPSVNLLSFAEASSIVEQGGVWLDVRFPSEFEGAHIKGSRNMPLNLLRVEMENLPRDAHYVVCCDTGGRSSTAAFLLMKQGLKASYLKGGFDANPEIIGLQEGADKNIAPRGQQVRKPAPDATAEVAEDDPELEASVLEADLAKNKFELNTATTKLQIILEDEEEGADKQERKSLEQLRKELELEKRKIEARKKKAEDEIEKKRKQEEERMRKAMLESESKLKKEREALEEAYAKRAEEVKKMEAMKASVEGDIKKQREKITQRAEQARRAPGKSPEELEKAKKAIEAEAAKKREKIAAMEKKLALRNKELLDKKKRELARRAAQNHEMVEKARRAKAAAEAKRTAAKEEAKKIVQEYENKLQDTAKLILDERNARLKKKQQGAGKQAGDAGRVMSADELKTKKELSAFEKATLDDVELPSDFFKTMNSIPGVGAKGDSLNRTGVLKPDIIKKHGSNIAEDPGDKNGEIERKRTRAMHLERVRKRAEEASKKYS